MPAAELIDASASGEMFFIMSAIIDIVAGSFSCSVMRSMSSAVGMPPGPPAPPAPPPADGMRILVAISIIRSISSGLMFSNMLLAWRAISGVIFGMPGGVMELIAASCSSLMFFIISPMFFNIDGSLRSASRARASDAASMTGGAAPAAPLAMLAGMSDGPPSGSAGSAAAAATAARASASADDTSKPAASAAARASASADATEASSGAKAAARARSATASLSSPAARRAAPRR